MSHIAEAIVQHLLSRPTLTSLVGQRIHANQAEQADYAYPYVVIATKATPIVCRGGAIDAGELVVEIYTQGFAQMRQVVDRLTEELENKEVGGFFLEDVQEEFDKVSTNTNGITVKELNLNYIK